MIPGNGNHRDVQTYSQTHLPGPPPDAHEKYGSRVGNQKKSLNRTEQERRMLEGTIVKNFPKSN